MLTRLKDSLQEQQGIKGINPNETKIPKQTGKLNMTKTQLMGEKMNESKEKQKNNNNNAVGDKDRCRRRRKSRHPK